jgi:Domain of Unknown Function (DUF748)
MDEQPQPTTPGSSDAAVVSARAGRRRTLLWIALGIATALVLLAALVTFAPTQVARWIVDRYFAGLGIDVSGVKTLDVDVLRGEVTFGPVSFQAGQAKPGRIGRLGLDLSLRKLFERQVLVRSLIVEDIDLRIVQSADGAFTMNGIPLGAWLQPSKEPAPGWEIGDWGGGVDSLNLRNARAVFITAYGGEASFTIQMLDVRDVQTWRPDQAGTFSFRGDVNGIEVSAEGRAWPFADPARAEGEIAINDVGLENIEQYTGSLNFEKSAGRLSLSSSLLASLDPQRHLQLGGEGVLRLADLDVARADLGRATMSEAEAPFKGDFTLGAGGAIQVAGTLGVNAGQSALSMAGGPAIGFQSLSLQPSEISASRAGDGAIAFEAKPHLEVQKASITSPELRLAARDITLDLSRMKIAQKRDELSLSLAGASGVNAISATLDTVSGRPQAKLDALAIDSGQLTFADTSAGRKITGGLGLELTKAEATWQGQAGAPLPNGSLARFRLDLSDLAVDEGDRGLTAGAKGTALLAGAALTSSVLKPYLGDWLKVGEARATLKDVVVTSADRTAWTAHFDAVMRDFGSGAVKGAPQFRAAAVYLREAQIDDRARIGADAIVLDKPEADITTAWIDSLTAGGRLEEDLDRVADQVSTFRLGQFSILDSWRLGLSDYKVQPPAYFTLKLDAVDLFDLDTGKPQQQSRLAIRGTLNEFTQLQSGGWASPFATQPSFELMGNVQRLQLPPLSPYATRAVGVTLESGNLQADATAKAIAGQLRGVIDINVADLAVASANSQQSGASSIVGVPVDTVIGLLQDNDGRIRLTVPFAGDLTSPAFDFTDAIDQALTGALQAAVTAPFRLAYLPVDLIVGMTQSGPPTLKPIPFTAGEATVGIEGDRVLQALALVLEQRPSLRIKVCGRATHQDREARLANEGFSASEALPPDQRQRLEGELGALAYDRTLAVRSALIREHGIASSQVQECRASYDAGDNGPPRVEIEL